MHERRWEPIVPYLTEFQSHLAPHVPNLQIIPGNQRTWSDEEYRTQCRTGVFNQYGVYLLFAEDESLEYVGLAMNSFQDRIWSHDDVATRRWTDLIPLPHEFYFLAPALEFFLICKLRPVKNRSYNTGYTIAPSSGPNPRPRDASG